MDTGASADSCAGPSIRPNWRLLAPATCRELKPGRVAGGVTAVSWLVPATWSRVGATVCRLWVLVGMVEQKLLRVPEAGTSTSSQSTAVRLPLRCSGRGALLLMSSSFLLGCSTAECSPSCVPCLMATSWAGHHSRRWEVLPEFGPARAREVGNSSGSTEKYVAGCTLMQMLDRRRQCAGRREQQPRPEQRVGNHGHRRRCTEGPPDPAQGRGYR
jgi:hypothetical protein